MNAKLSIALLATLIAFPAFAGQQFGRDSVYATHTAAKPAPANAAAPQRFGRDSVYATGSHLSAPVTVANTVHKFGRA